MNNEQVKDAATPVRLVGIDVPFMDILYLSLKILIAQAILGAVIAVLLLVFDVI